MINDEEFFGDSYDHKHVFVFGSNASGFHGAGAAGFAMRGDSKNNWRSDVEFLKKIEALKETGEHQRGDYAVLGQSHGIQGGTKGMGYAIMTIKKPGMKRSVGLDEIREQVFFLKNLMAQRRDLIFCISKFGAGLAGYTEEEMIPLWNELMNEPNARWAKMNR